MVADRVPIGRGLEGSRTGRDHERRDERERK